MAPEVADNNRKEAYTNAVDIWSLGAVTFCIHTGKPPFHSDLAVGRYIDGKGAFPFDRLLKFSGKLVIFIMQLMDVVSTRRPSVDGVLEHEWLKPRNEVSTPDQEIEITAHGEWSAPASAEWPDPPDDSIGEANDYIPPADSTRPSAPASAEWPDPPDSPIGEPKGSIPTTNSTGPSSPPYPKDLVVDSSQPPLSPIKRPLSPLPRIHHAASNPIDKKTSGYDEPLAPRPSSSPAGDVEFDLAPNIKDHSKKHIYVESFRKLHGIDHVGFAPLDQPLAQPTYLLPTQKASEHPPWKLSHADSGYSTASASSALPNPKNAANLTPVKLQPIPAESPQPNDYDLLFFSDSAEVQNCVSTKFVGPLQQNQVRVNLDEYDINVSSGATLSQIENNLIDFNHSNPFRRDKTQQAPQYGPWLPSDNNAKATESRPFQNVFEPLDSNPWT
ncbi:hypothetical protein F5Y19DRAFT_348177 [Xylariaceae sp. FL1651]|nr:hypothetical protein F5Y19DRAFT_348177 [Xylariaceae sp. FL1651]